MPLRSGKGLYFKVDNAFFPRNSAGTISNDGTALVGNFEINGGKMRHEPTQKCRFCNVQRRTFGVFRSRGGPKGSLRARKWPFSFPWRTLRRPWRAEAAFRAATHKYVSNKRGRPSRVGPLFEIMFRPVGIPTNHRAGIRGPCIGSPGWKSGWPWLFRFSGSTGSVP